MMARFTLTEVDCPNKKVTIEIGAHLLGPIAKCLQNCGELRRDWIAARSLGTQLGDAGDLIFGAVEPDDMPEYLDVADRVILPDGKLAEVA